MSGNRTRLEAKVFWEQVQERNCAKPVNWYNVCENW